MGRLAGQSGGRRQFKSKHVLGRKQFQKATNKLLIDENADDFGAAASAWESGWGETSQTTTQTHEVIEEIQRPPLDLPLPLNLPPLLDPNNLTNNANNANNANNNNNDNNNNNNKKSMVMGDNSIVVQTPPARRRKPKSPFPTNWGTLDDSIWKLRRQHKRRTARGGFKVVNGRLLSVNDVGVLLREAAERVARRRKLFYATNQPAMTTKLARKRRLMALARRRRQMMSFDGVNDVMDEMSEMMNLPYMTRPLENLTLNTRANRLIIDTKSRAENKVLAIYNLTIGVNANNLKKIIEKLGETKITDLKIKDLLSGSAMGYATLENTTLKEMQRIKDLFNGALVDGRTIKVDIISTAMAALAY